MMRKGCGLTGGSKDRGIDDMLDSGTLDKDYKKKRRQTDEERTATTPAIQGRDSLRCIIERYSVVV